MITLTVNLAERSYPILIGSGLLGQPGILDPYVPGNDVLIVTNDTVGPIYLEPLKTVLGSRNIATVELPDGEANKTMATLQTVLDKLVDSKFGRDCTVVTLGGGVSGDIGGFAAAVYAALSRYPNASEWQMRWELVGHICRCNAYENIVTAACEASRQDKQVGVET